MVKKPIKDVKKAVGTKGGDVDLKKRIHSGNRPRNRVGQCGDNGRGFVLEAGRLWRYLHTVRFIP